MNTPKPEISRKQAWCKLAVLVAGGLPEPESISFNPHSRTSIGIVVDSVEALNAWVATLGLTTIHTPILSNDRTVWIHDAWDYWHGWHTRVHTTAPAVDDEPVDEDMTDMTAVRALAADTCVCCSPGDCGDRRGHVRNDRDGGDLCNCGRDWPCEKAGA